MVELRKRAAAGDGGDGRASKVAKKAVSRLPMRGENGGGKKGRGGVSVKKTKKGDVDGGVKKDVEKEKSTGDDSTVEDVKEAASDGESTTKDTDNAAIPASTAVDTIVEKETTEAQGGEKATVPLHSDAVGKSIPDLSSFGGTIKTNSGEDVTFKTLLEKSEKGIVIFTYPKASTPGCTTQACLFRDSYTPLTKAGLSIYGLSTDSPKANTTFVTKQKLPFELLCDAGATLTGAIGLKKGVGKGTLRGVVLVGRDGEVKVWEQGGPKRTLDVVLEWVG